LLQWTTLQVHNADAPDPEAQRGSVGGDLAAGFKFVWNEKLLLALLLSRFGPVTLASGFQVLIPVFAVTVLGMGAGAYGALLSAEGLGAIIGGFTIASRKRIARPGLIALIAGSALGILLVLALFVSVFWVFCLLLVLIGISQITFQSSNNGAMFDRTPPHMRGRMVGVRNQSRAFVPFSNLGAGAIAEVVGVQPTFAIFGAASLAVLWAVHLWRPDLRLV
jgi:MFS family permease